ncbi:MAG TPA: GyrI-like domain-containing protein [Candidatus Methanofastidiosa archaeon]|nr:GyrI-like domain-containing protein [Candidatus Methanofastidiosa archaeon]
MEKIDLKKEFRELYPASQKEPKVVEVPEMAYLMVDGQGDPNTSKDFSDAIEALYSLSYAVKFISKKEMGRDFVVMPLEAVWWADDLMSFLDGEKDKWKWTLMIMQPSFITGDMVGRATENVGKKKSLETLGKIRFEKMYEGLSAQIMHLGPYSEEAPTIERLHRFIGENGYKLNGKHREIYLSDPRRAEPERHRTIIRQPIR